MDQQISWNNVPHYPMESQNLLGYTPSASDNNMSYLDIDCQGNASSSIWNNGASSSSQGMPNIGTHEGNKLEDDWTCSLGSRSGGPRIGQSQSEQNNTLSLENIDIDLNSNHVENGLPLSLLSDFNELSQNSGYKAEHVGTSSQVPKSGLSSQLENSVLPQFQHVSSSSGSSVTFESSSRAVHFFSGNEGGRQGVVLNGQCFSHKRKNIEEVPGQSSASASSSHFNSSADLTGEEINTRAIASDHHYFTSAAGNEESFWRNTRTRSNHAHITDISRSNVFPQSNIIRLSNHSSIHQPSSPPVPSYQGRLPLGQPHVPTTPGFSSILYPFPRNGTSIMRMGSSSSPLAVVGERAITVEPNSRNDLRNNHLEQPTIVPVANPGHAVQNPTNWGLSNGNTGVPGNTMPISQDGSNFGVHQSLGANWVYQQRHRLLSEVVHRSFVLSGSEPRGQNMNLPPHHRHFSASQEIGGDQSGTVPHNPQQSSSRSPILNDRQNHTVSGTPLSMQTPIAPRIRRNRTISEIRNMFDLIRRRDNLLLEELLSEQSEFFGGADFHDRHRDMRLDVDNMSYEELLALEERIGNVNTGLSEESIMKCLKQQKFVSNALESLVEVEPCCICREEYTAGDELGRLDCGHDFHTACIKQWLILKNLCPICRTTALAT